MFLDWRIQDQDDSKGARLVTIEESAKDEATADEVELSSSTAVEAVNRRRLDGGAAVAPPFTADDLR